MAIAAYGLALVSKPDAVPGWRPEGDAASISILSGGVLVLLVGLIFIVRRSPIPMAPTPQEAPRPLETVEIKRTEMRWGETSPAEPAEAASDDRLEAIQQQISKLKVQFGLGQVSPEAYKRLLEDLQAEEAELTRTRFREGRT